MGYTKKTLQELNLMDDFLSNAIASNQEVNEPFYRLLLSVLLGKEVKKVRILAQRIIPAAIPGLRGIRMDVEIKEYDEESVTNIYDLEPHRKNDLHMPRHNRYYQAKIDGRYVRRGLKDFSKIPNLYVITITNYDLFGQDYMMYTVRNRCEEIPEMEYDDGLRFLYFYTKGSKGGSQAIKNMLTYIQNSDSKNAVDDATRKIDSYVKQVKNLPEVEDGYMTLGDWIDDIVDEAKEDMREEVRREVIEEVTREVTEQVKRDLTEQVKRDLAEQVRRDVTEQVTRDVTDRTVKSVIAMLQDLHYTKEDAVAKLRITFPECVGNIGELADKYWMEK